jgi:hypothetical protein
MFLEQFAAPIRSVRPPARSKSRHAGMTGETIFDISLFSVYFHGRLRRNT